MQCLKSAVYCTLGSPGSNPGTPNSWKWWRIVPPIQTTWLQMKQNISLGEITAYSSYQSPFISTNSISFSISKRKSQIKATSHIPVETCELYYNHVLQTPAISHSKIRFSNKSFTFILNVTGISKSKLLIKTLKDLFLKNKPETQP